MPRTLRVIGLLTMLIGGLMLVGIVPSPLATVVGQNLILSITNFKVTVTGIGPTSQAVLTYTVKNTASNVVQYYQLIQVSSADDKGVYPCSGSLTIIPLRFISDSLSAGQQKDVTINLVAPVGWAEGRIYEVCMDMWQPTPNPAPECVTNPFGFSCTYIQIAVQSTTQFTIQRLTTATMYIQKCYGLTNNQLSFCSEYVIIDYATTEPNSPFERPNPFYRTTGESVTLKAIVKDSTKVKFLYWIKNFDSENFPATQISGDTITVQAENNALYTAIFQKITQPPVPVIPKLSIIVQPAGYGTTSPVAGTYDKVLNEAVTIVMSPATNQTIAGSSTIRVFTLYSVSVTKEGALTPADVTTYPNDNPLVQGTKSTKSIQVTMDKNTNVMVTFKANDIICVTAACQAPPPPTGCVGSFCLPSTFSWFGILLVVAGAVIYTRDKKGVKA